MTGEIEISHGGAIAVDPQALRDVGARITAMTAVLGEAQEAVRRAHAAIVDAPAFGGSVDTGSLASCGETVGTLRRRCGEAATGTLLMADVYELVELRVQAGMMALTDSAAAEALLRRIERLEGSDERLAPMADALIRNWEEGRYEGLDRQGDLGGLLAPFFAVAPMAGSLLGRGVIPQGATLRGAGDPVTVTEVRYSKPVSAPGSLTEALGRMPVAAGAQVAVEKLIGADGRTVRYVAYVKGTQSPLYGGSEPWDMKSNVELYTGQESASFRATVEALKMAGATEGDRVDVFAHSQAGMIGAYLEAEGGFRVERQFPVGSPVSPMLDDDHTVVQLGHTDDIVRSLAGGGSPGGTGSDDSFTVTGVAPSRLFDLPWDSHTLDAYQDMAEQVDQSSDPRAVALDAYWRELNDAATIERTEYHAERAG